jgi:FkbM family methyltransferase
MRPQLVQDLRSVARAIGVRVRAGLDPNKDVSYYSTQAGQVLAVPGYSHTGVYRRGTTDPNLFHLMAGLPKGATTFDIGASIGEFAILAASVAVDGEVHCFEPNPIAFPFLELNLGLNRCTNVRAHNHALWDSSDTGTLRFASQTSRGRLLQSADRCARGEVDVPIVCVRGDEYVQQNGISRLDFIKIDVEGGELAVLDGFGGVLETANLRGVLVLEVDGHSLDEPRLFRHLERLHYLPLEFSFDTRGRLDLRPVAATGRSPADRRANPNVLALPSEREAHHALTTGLRPEALFS